MMSNRLSTTLCILFAIAGLPAALWAQPASEAAVSGQGTVTIERPAQLLRMQIDLTARHKDAKEALGKLKQLREAAVAKVVELGAARDAVKFAEPTLGTLGASSDAEMQRMVMERMRGRKADEKATQTPLVVASARLTAEWPLTGGSPEERLLYSHELREKIKAADLGGSKEAGALSAAEQEVLDESEGGPSYGSPQRPKPGEPSFVFVAKIAEDERAQALADAFAKARAQAERLAKAAGMLLGSIRGLSGNFGPADYGGEYDGYNRYMAAMQAQQTMTGTADDTPEAVGPQPGKVEYHLMVNASFGLKPQ